MTSKSTALVAALAMGFAVSAAQSADATHEEAALSNAKVSLSQAIGMAEQQGSGQAISAEYEPKKGAAGHYEIKVLSSDGTKLVKYRLSPTTGKVTSGRSMIFSILNWCNGSAIGPFAPSLLWAWRLATAPPLPP